MNKVEEQVRKDFINEYMLKCVNLEMKIDACQGCMDDLDYAMERVNMYKLLIHFLGADYDEMYSKYLDNFYKQSENNKKGAKV